MLSGALIFYLCQGEAAKGEPEVVYNAESFAAQLLKNGSDPNATEPESGMKCLWILVGDCSMFSTTPRFFFLPFFTGTLFRCKFALFT